MRQRDELRKIGKRKLARFESARFLPSLALIPVALAFLLIACSARPTQPQANAQPNPSTPVAANPESATSASLVAVDQRTHRVYFPLQNVNGNPVLRIAVPSDKKAS